MLNEFRNPAPRVAVIGGGYSGIAAAVALRRAGVPFQVFEKSDDIGGTWWDNVYPGAEVDTPSVLYSFSYAPRVWSRTHVRGAELLDYLHEVARRYRVTDHVRTGVQIDRVEWVEEAHAYRLTADGVDVGLFEGVVSAVGFLNIPKYPEWPGIESFAGPRVHTSRWPAGLDIAGLRVGVVGTGSTAAQVVPTIAPQCREVVLFQREPGWVLPKGDREYTPAEQRALGSPLAQRINRFNMLWRREKSQTRNAGWRPGTPQNRAAETTARRYIKTVFADRPDLAEAVTPRYPYGGKRPVLTDVFYPALLRDNVRLIPRPVQRVTEHGVVDSSGTETPLDVLVMATGFQTDFSFNYDLITRDGRKLTDLWNGDPYAFLGIMVPRVPNFFIMYGPNTNGGSILTHLEAQADYIARAVRALGRKRATQIEVSARATEIFNRILQRRLDGASFTVANNYYKSASGRIVTQWSDGAIMYSALTRVLGRPVWHFAGRRGRIAAAAEGLARLRSLCRDVGVLNRVDTGGVWTSAGD